MSQPARILLVTPEPVKIEPPTDRITCVSGHSDLTSDQLETFTHLAAGPIRRSVSSDKLLLAVESSAPARTLFPLESYEWISILHGAPALLNVIPGADAGSVVVSPGGLLPDTEPNDNSTEPGSSGSCSYLRDLPFIAALRIETAHGALGQALLPFVPPQLVPSQREADLERAMESLRNDLRPRSSLAGIAFMAGVHQVNNDLDGSHQLAQSIEGDPDGDYWHAIMHRREPDYGNSKYWFRRVGRHPVFADLASRAAEILNDAPSEISHEWAGRLKVDSGWDPFAFVDMCQQAASDEDGDFGLTARSIQWIEMLLLLRHCARSA